ncbi:MAG: transcriptional regulator [Sulfobacillus benefaciens]|uniref:Transcriptional regulator n=1 Tax=Sulfobacillus benefaciens TaxID=453960 RepID=A0A2T2XDM4_9FIRM|nr:MAG: transcriptional regulator [Sulfobacillus benefaciens]
MDDRLVIKVSKWYYEDQVTQEEIARRVGISRSTISRMLTYARRQGIVKITVESPPSELFDFGLETFLESQFGLSEVLVCNCDPQSSGSVLGAMAADLLLRNLTSGQSIGLSWGRSVAAVVDAVPRTRDVNDLTVVALSGGVGAVKQGYLGNTLVLKLAERLNAQAITLDAPAILQQETYQRLVAEPAVARVLECAQTVDIALVGIGAVGVFSTLTATEYLAPHMVATLESMGAVGDLCSRFYSADGQLIDSDLDRRTIGITFDALKRVPRVIGIAWGQEKVLAILGALRLGVLNVLVTDKMTALLLKHSLEA